MKTSRFTFALLFLVVLSSVAAAQTLKKANCPDLLDEMAIMKGVLKEMFSKNQSIYLESNSVDAICLPDYGMVFSVKTDWDNSSFLLKPDFAALRISEATQDSLLHQLQRQQEKLLRLQKDLLDSQQILFKSQKRLAARQMRQLKKKSREVTALLKDFLENYADVGDLLQPNQRVTVFLTGDLASSTPEVPTFYSVKKSDILRFRSGKLSEKGFWARVQKGKNPPPEIRKQIEIMTQIFKTGLKTGSHDSWGTPPPKAHLLPDYGVWFNMGSPQLGALSLAVFLKDKNTVAAKVNAKQKTGVRKYYQRLTELLGQYGFSLRFMRPDQWVLVSFHPGGFLDGSQGQIYLLRVKKVDIEKLHRKKISQKEFQKRVQLTILG